MPTVQPGSKVLVTGASGFVASWIVKALLDGGYRVRGTVRSKSKGDYLATLFGDRFEYVIVDDMEKEGAFNEAVKGVDAIEHTASPARERAYDPAELIGPAVQGTLSILEAVFHHAPNVKRIVITSSSAAVVDPAKSVKNLNEDQWSESTIEEVKVKGVDASFLAKYCASKTLAEQAAWKFMEDHKDSIKFDLVTLQPPFVFGPMINQVLMPDHLVNLQKWFLDVLKGDKSDDELIHAFNSWVDVRDVALAHVRSIEVGEAGGNRIILCAPGVWSWQDLLNVLDRSKHAFRKGKLGATTIDNDYAATYNNSKSVKLLGMEYTSLKESVTDMANYFVERGWLN